MKKLYLLRHGEAGFSEGLDFERNLTPRGVDQLTRMAALLQKRISKIDFMYCSSAHRTRQTAEVILSEIQIVEKEYTPLIYEGKLTDLLGLLESLPPRVHSCLVVGHNPIISLLLSHLTNLSYQNMSPGTFAQLEMELDSWELIGMGTCSLREINY
ncbi:SixA phosphatase family protein [Algoriphagus namhaensis]